LLIKCPRRSQTDEHPIQRRKSPSFNSVFIFLPTLWSAALCAAIGTVAKALSYTSYAKPLLLSLRSRLRGIHRFLDLPSTIRNILIHGDAAGVGTTDHTRLKIRGAQNANSIWKSQKVFVPSGPPSSTWRP
jgi:hypothetical protein